MAKKFSEQEKEYITARLIQECESMWGRFGYKKTNVNELCQKVGIAKGTFYLFFDSKEQLFLEVLNQRLKRQKDAMLKELEKSPNNAGFRRGLIATYPMSLDENWFENFNGPEFRLLIARLPEGTEEFLLNQGDFWLKEVVEKYQLKFKIDKNLFLTTIQSAHSVAAQRDDFGEDTEKIIETLINALFEAYAL